MKKNSCIFASLIAAALVGWFLSLVFSGALILPQYFLVGRLEFHYYGIFMALAIVSGYVWARSRARRYGIDLESADAIIFWLLVGGFVGARLYHVLSSFSYYFKQPPDIFKVWNGGLSIYGAVLGGLFVLWLQSKIAKNNFKVLSILDWLTPSLVLGQIIGRFGNLFNYELYGYPTLLPWKMFVPRAFRFPMFSNSSFYHPLFLYEVVGNAIILCILLWLEKRAKPSGQKTILMTKTGLFLWYLLLYNSMRFSLEFLRIDSTYLGHVRINAYVSLVLALGALVLLVKKNHGKVP